MDPVNVRYLLGVLRRQWWVMLQAMVIVGAAAGWATTRLPEKPYESTATLILKGVANENDATIFVNNPDIYFATQVRVLKSEGVAEAAAKSIDPALTASDVLTDLETTYDSFDGTISITSKGADPARAVAIPNAFVEAFVSYQQDAQSASLQARAAQLDADLAASDKLIAEITDQMIADIFENGATDVNVLEARQAALIQQNLSLFSEKQALLTQIASQPTVAEPLEPASEAKRPPNPSVPLRAGIGALVGLVLGIALAALREALDDKLRSPEQVGKLSGAPLLVEIPKAGGKLDSKVSVFDQPDRGLSESIRSLRTSIRFLDVGEPIHSVAVTSPAPGDGKSLTAANLAAAFAMSGTRTVLVSGDLRRPSMDARFGVSGQSGFSDVLLIAHERERGVSTQEERDAFERFANVTAEYYLVDTEIPNLRILPSGTPVPNPAELLGSRHLREVLKELGAVADMVIIDCPPTVVTDGVLLSRLADGCVLVTSLNRSRKSALRLAVDRMKNAKVNLLGLAVNRSGPERRSSYSYYRPQAMPADSSGSTPRPKEPSRPKR